MFRCLRPVALAWGVVVVCACMIAVSPGRAEDGVGVASAVNQSAQSQRDDGALRTIRIGNEIFDRERILTGASGRVQVLLADGSNFVVGPNSSLVIDEFVYRPESGDGRLVATFGRGVARFVGGKVSKQRGGVTIRTRQGTVGIRGGIVDLFESEDEAAYAFLFGDGVTFTGTSGRTDRVYRSGFSILVSNGKSRTQRTPGNLVDEIRALLTGAGSSGGKPAPGQLRRLSQINSDLPPSPGRQIPPPVLVTGAQTLPNSRVDFNHANAATITPPPSGPYDPVSTSLARN